MTGAAREALIAALPKAELHVHLEGTLEPELALTLAARNGVTLRFADVASLRRAYDFRDLQSFLDLYYELAATLVTRADFRELAAAYLARAAADNARHVEAFFDPQTHLARGIALGDVVDGLVDAFAEAERRRGVTWRLIPCILRHLDARAAEATLDALAPFVARFAALGLDSGERGNPPGRFAATFARARALGLKTVAHAGEEGPPAYIAEALDALGVSRIDHGVRCLEDEALTARLVAERIPLTVCPLSNVRLRVFARAEDHNLARLMARGLLVTVNSDDPAFFGGYLEENYRVMARALDLAPAALVALAANGFAASFLAPAEKAGHLAEIRAVATRHGVAPPPPVA
jgi:adenosine deaminase